MNSIKYITLFILLLFISSLKAQDTLRTLSAQEVMEIVKRFHPVAKQADIFIEKAKTEVTIAKGMFDPVLQNEMAQKTFDGNDYYYYNRPELSIPTWFGVEVFAGLEYLSGNRTDPVETKGETSYFGISIPLAKNLFMDKRRAALQSAKIFREASSIEKKNMLNNLLLEAMTSYWNWVRQYQIYKILADAVSVNEKRVELVKIGYELGDRPAIDTTEALAQLQNFEMLKSQALLDFQNTALELSVYLWTADTKPYNLPVDIIPNDDLKFLNVTAIPKLDSLLETAMQNHPELVIYNYKLNVLGIEKKLKFQELLPKINLKYNQLGKGYDVLKTATIPLFENNFQYGLSLGIPLRLSQGRGDYRKAKLKITETQLQLDQKRLEVETKIKRYYNELFALKKQIALQELTYKNYQTLLRGEEIRYQAGESSLFLINARENKMLEALQKLQELKAKYYKTEIVLQWSAGILIR
ncbi:TolC family protein [Ferruginibacter sp. SUN002]|uniref:TolC family protein n=1 Tax=Ferruginibacter sp. SUN002 TaxID=2937789 RepID=UPI003D36F034